MKFTLAKLAKVTAAYVSSNLFLTATAFALFIIFLIAAFPLSNSHLPIDPEPSMTITLSTKVGDAFLFTRLFVGFINKKLVRNLFAVTSMEGTFWYSAKEKPD